MQKSSGCSTNLGLIINQFNFHDRYYKSGYWDFEFTEEEEIAYFHPFGCECRAYARLQERGIEDIVAVPCFGYVVLDEANLEQLRSKDNFDLEQDWGYYEEDPPRPWYALVKKYISLPSEDDLTVAQMTEVNVSLKTASTLIRNVKFIHRSGILIQDINTENVFHGKMIEFSLAWTAPHPCLNSRILDNKEYFPMGVIRISDGCELRNSNPSPADSNETDSKVLQTTWID